MKLKRALFKFVGLLALISNVTLAEQSDAKSNLRAILKNLHSFEASFKQSVTDSEGELLQQSQGVLTLKQPNLMRWEVQAPDENTLIADGQTLWHIDPFVEQVIAMDQKQSVENNPIILLTDVDGQNWDKFSISQENNGYQVTSIDPQSQILSLTLTFDGNTLTSLVFVDRQQQSSRLVFEDIQQNIALTDNTFEFSLPQGYELDDQR